MDLEKLQIYNTDSWLSLLSDLQRPEEKKSLTTNAKQLNFLIMHFLEKDHSKGNCQASC